MFDPAWSEPPDLPGELNDEDERVIDPLELLTMQADLEALAPEEFDQWVEAMEDDDGPLDEPGCTAYKPWIRVTCQDGTLQPTCAQCPKLGNCMWTTPADAKLAQVG